MPPVCRIIDIALKEAKEGANNKKAAHQNLLHQ